MRRTWTIIATLVIVTVAAYWQTGRGDFVNLDDDVYVVTQPMTNQGLRPAAVLWAWTGIQSNTWNPLTALSHTLDCEFFGVRPGPMHWENLAWHVLNTVLVFLVWRALTAAAWPSALVAALFALHPLHVESVAWISERKDLLSTFFWLLGLWAYVHYTRLPSRTRLVGVMVCFALGLLAKPMNVTFPCTLLLVDYWPLRRWPAQSWWKLIREKLPLFGMAAALSLATYLSQKSTGAANYGQRFTFAARLGNALVACARYLGKTFWPESLVPFYPHPGYWPVGAVLGALFLLILISALAWRTRRNYPWLIVGWLWFVGTLVPVIGLVQVGAQSMADRYTYVPLLGIFTVLAWAAAALVAHWPRCRALVVAIAVGAIGGCFVLTSKQVAVWQNSFRLYEHSLAVGEDNATIQYLLATALQAAGRPEAEVVAHYQRAIALAPDYINAYTQLAGIALGHQRIDEARRIIEHTLRLEPRNAGLHKNLGAVSLWQGKPDESIAQLEEALRLNPADPSTYCDLAGVYLRLNRLAEARQQLEIAVRVAPWDFSARCNLGIVLSALGQKAEARRCFQRALWINPAFAEASRQLLLLDQGTPPPKS